MKLFMQAQVKPMLAKLRFAMFHACLAILAVAILLINCQYVRAEEIVESLSIDQMLNPLEDVDKVSFPVGSASKPVLIDHPSDSPDINPQQSSQTPVTTLPKKPHNVMGALIAEMQEEERQGFLKYQQTIYAAHVENLRRHIAVLQADLAGRQKDHDEMSSAGYREVTTIRIMLTNALYIESRTPNLVAAMLSGNMNPSGAHAINNSVSLCANPQHPYFEIARLTLKLAALNKRLGDSLVSLQQIGQAP